MHITATSINMASLIGLAAAGINCNGSGNCPGVAGSLDDIISLANGLDDGRVYQNGQKIVCIRSQLGTGLCAFPQNTGGIRGDSVKSLLRALKDHGCGKCGSVPVFFPSDNDENSHGILTVNAVTGTDGCNGVC